MTGSLTSGVFPRGSQQEKNKADAAWEAKKGPGGERWEGEWQAVPREADSQVHLGGKGRLERWEMQREGFSRLPLSCSSQGCPHSLGQAPIPG